MSNEEILALERELAELLGWTGVREAARPGTLERVLYGHPPDDLVPPHVELEVPRFARDIAAAWSVVERFEVVEITKGEEFARCRIRVGKGHPAYEAGCDYVSDHSDTSSVPYAICLAALKALNTRVARRRP